MESCPGQYLLPAQHRLQVHWLQSLFCPSSQVPLLPHGAVLLQEFCGAQHEGSWEVSENEGLTGSTQTYLLSHYPSSQAHVLPDLSYLIPDFSSFTRGVHAPGCSSKTQNLSPRVELRTPTSLPHLPCDSCSSS